LARKGNIADKKAKIPTAKAKSPVPAVRKKAAIATMK
jgi:hypothetical protein